jgi:predicted phage-related endonuclease
MVAFQDRDGWLVGRRASIGSSDGPAILGYGYANQCKTSTWRSKVFGEEIEFDEPTRKLLDEGKKCEPFVVARFAMQHPEFRVVPGDPYEVLVSDSHDWIAATLDATANDGSGEFPVECKWIGRFMARDWEDGETPIKYQIQLMHQMFVTGAKRGCIAAFVAGEYVERWQEWDQEIVDYMLGEYEEFWRCVQTKTPPVDDSPLAYRALRPEIDRGAAKAAGGSLSRLIREYIAAEQVASETRAVADRAKNAIAREVGGVEYVVLDDQSVVKLGKGVVKSIRRLPRGVRLS